MRILICGDVNARSGRESVDKYLHELKNKLSIDFVLLNVDNAAGGFGINKEIANAFFAAGANVLTGGNHVFDQNGAIGLLESEKKLLRPFNMAISTPGKGVCEAVTGNGKKVVVIHLLGQKDMPCVANDPFEAMTQLLSKYKLGQTADAIIVDFHAELTSEKNALGHFLDGRVSAVVGTHTHIPTADERILEYGTAFQTDIGMCGDYDSIIGMKKETAVEMFSKNYVRTKLTSASGEATFCGLLVDLDDKSGLAKFVKFIKLGGKLSQSIA
ncbi:metallophosphoesterase [Alphaproteobacteria bacterium]|nr:metallophosphoesterase [Alphaproteobacteria bacterium]GHT91167.1 metallophosphoesterase [Alphaproteobacteria bacterium]